MDFVMLVFLSIFYVPLTSKIGEAATFNVMSFGAKGNGKTDDINAFKQAWAKLCGDGSPNPTLIIPSGKTFLLSPIAFQGPCKSSTINIKLMGNIIAPNTLNKWKGCIGKEFWIYFSSVHGLVIDGPGQIDGHGSLWWRGKAKTPTCNRPSALHFHSCNGLQLSGTTHINSPKLHISINDCQGVDVGNLRISAPPQSPNTDGIDVSASSHVSIHDSNIQTGDDCVAINGGTYDVNVTRVFCGPGHGISIGSLGENHGHDTVEQVRVENCNITGTQNGLRIKTVPYGTGYARRILFQGIHLNNVANPIIIDQHYCDSMLNHYCPAPPSAPAVQVSDVTYTNIYGTTATPTAITLDCSEKFKCTKIIMNHVGITGKGVSAYCKNAKGKFIDTYPPVSCN